MGFTCATAAETLNKVLLEQRPHGSIAVRDGNGRSINTDELLHYVRTKPSASFWSIRPSIQGGR
jgi:hypothetical protein